MCRGLITNLDGRVLARPFSKFFNLNESEESKIENLPAIESEIYEKLDGSFLIQYYSNYDKDDNKVYVATRGSFKSDQAKWGTEWLQNKGYRRADFKEGYTYMYEAIYPGNRIVVDYDGREECVLLAVKEIETGKEIDHIEEAKRLGLPYARKFNHTLQQLLELLPQMYNEEGYVAKYSDGLRVKLKGEDYKRLHKLLTQFSTTSIWEYLKDGKGLKDVEDRVPVDFKNWVEEKKNVLVSEKCSIIEAVKKAYGLIKGLESRKEQALKLMKEHKKVAPLVFNLLDGKEESAEQGAWKMVKPKWELPFRKEMDNG